MKVGKITALKKPVKPTFIRPTLFTVNKKAPPELNPSAPIFFQALPAVQQKLMVATIISDSSAVAEEINQLIKKIYLSFTDKKLEAKFLVSGGIFDQAQFSIVMSAETLSLEVKNASAFAQNLLWSHRDFMKNRLKAHGIELHHLRFI